MSHITEAAETLDFDGAHRLAKKVTQYWSARGHTNVRVWVEPFKRRDTAGQQRDHIYYMVQSNLFNAKPPL